jgi:hypothetical protein
VPAELPHTLICADGDVDRGMCMGDSGGPLLAKNGRGADVLIGVLSFGSLNCSAGDPMVASRFVLGQSESAHLCPESACINVSNCASSVCLVL